MTRHLYVHIPYCDVICPYCDFLCDLPKNLPPASRYVDALIRDLDARSGTFETVYFGGGTPSELPLADLERLLAAVAPRLDRSYEWTIEANPRSLDAERIALIARHGVNRVSLGIQSAEDRILKKLGRAHRHRDTIAAVDLVRNAGIEQISGDLIYGLPEENLAETLEFMSASALDHISAYELTIEGESTWSKRRYDPSVDGEDKFLRTAFIVNQLQSAGYHRYEISNFARPGRESRHNLNVWRCGDFAAIGAGAHGFENGVRYHVTESISEYVKQNSIKPDKESNPFLETLLCVMRLPEGIETSALPARNRDAMAAQADALERLAKQGYIEHSTARIRSTAKGLRFLNDALVGL